MKSKIFSLALIGSVITGISTGAITASADNKISASDVKAAEVVTELIENGYMKIDKETGRILLKKNVYEIVKKYSAKPSGATPASTENKKTGGGCDFGM